VPAKRRSDKEVLEVDTGTAEKGREVVEEEGKARGLSFVRGDHDLGHPTLAEERLPELVLIGDDLVRQVFVVDELADEVENQADIVDGRKTENGLGVAGGDGVGHGFIL